MADTLDLKSSAVRREGSNPSTPTIIVHLHREAQSLLADIEYACERDADWMLATDAAKALGVSRQFINDLIKRGVLLGVNGKRTWVYKPSVDDRIAYIAEHGRPTRGGARKKGKTADNIWLNQHYPELSKEVWS